MIICCPYRRVAPFSLNITGSPTSVSTSNTLKLFIALQMSAENAGVMRACLCVFKLYIIYRLSFFLIIHVFMVLGGLEKVIQT